MWKIVTDPQHWLQVQIYFIFRRGEDVRKISDMSYRDQWNLLRGPPRVRGRSELAAARRKKKGTKDSSSEEDTGDEADLDPIEYRKRRRKRTARRTKFYKVSYLPCKSPEQGQKIWLCVVQCCGSGIRCFFTPWIRDEFFPDPGSKGYVFGEIFLRILVL
jgi:hypothetical protein